MLRFFSYFYATKVSTHTIDLLKSKKLDWASSHNSYFDEFTGDTDYQIITIILIYSLIALSISLIHDIRLVTIVFFEFPERTQTRKNVHINCARCKTT